MKINRDVRKYATYLIKKHFPKKTIKFMRPIHAGYTNFSYYVQLNDESEWQVRIPHDEHLINREVEAGVLKITNNKDFYYFDPKTGVAIKKWIKAKNPGFFSIRNATFSDELFKKIKEVHTAKIPKSLDIKTLNFDAYNQNLYRLKFIYQKKFLCILDRHRDDPLVLNHTDVNPKNILLTKDKKVHLIDYEWAAKANDYFDYANYVRESGINYKHIDWAKYIDNFDMKKFKENIYISCVYAFLWTYAMPQSPKIIAYRKKTFKQIRKHYRAVINYENDIIKPL